MAKELQIWADSFHEGRWVAQELSKRLSVIPGSYERGYIPVFDIPFQNEQVRVSVLGDYGAWTPVPAPIAELLQYGKPDFVLYAVDEGRILFVAEETAAVPTGNQSTQRLERMMGACLQDPPVPFAYLLPEYGLHVDGSPRRASVWPVLLATKLGDQYSVVSLVLMFGDRGHPEDYAVGPGPNLLFDLIATYLKEYAELPNEEWEPDRRILLARSRALMVEFAEDQGPSMLKYLPPLCRTDHLEAGLDWPLSTEVSAAGAFATPPLLRPDPFLSAVYQIVGSHRAYTLVPGSGSKPQPIRSLESYQCDHVRDEERHPIRPTAYAGYQVALDSLPTSNRGNVHLTASQDITFLFDDGSDLVDCFAEAFARPEAIDALRSYLDHEPVFLYTAASMKKGRVFGDPYSGQLSCFAQVLSRDHDNCKQRSVVAYFPLQSYAIFPAPSANWNTSKGLRLYQRYVDVVICHGGVLVLPERKEFF